MKGIITDSIEKADDKIILNIEISAKDYLDNLYEYDFKYDELECEIKIKEQAE